MVSSTYSLVCHERDSSLGIYSRFFFFLSGTFVVESFRWSLSEPGKCLETAAGQQSWTDTQDAKRVVCWSTTCVKSPQTSARSSCKTKGALIRATSYQANLSRQRRSSLLLSEPSGTFPAGFQPPWSLKIKNWPQKKPKIKREDCALHRAPASNPWNWTWQSISSSCLQYNWKRAMQMFALLSCSIICVCSHQTARSPRCRTLAANAAAPRLYLCLFIVSAFHWTRHSPETFLISPRSPPPPPPPPPSRCIFMNATPSVSSQQGRRKTNYSGFRGNLLQRTGWGMRGKKNALPEPKKFKEVKLRALLWIEKSLIGKSPATFLSSLRASSFPVASFFSGINHSPVLSDLPTHDTCKARKRPHPFC